MTLDIIIIFVAVLFLSGLIYVAYQDKEKMTYVHPKTGNKYKIISFTSKYKDPDTRKWSDTVTYCSLKDGHIYVRDKSDFYKSMINIKDWKKQKKTNVVDYHSDN